MRIHNITNNIYRKVDWDNLYLPSVKLEINKNIVNLVRCVTNFWEGAINTYESSGKWLWSITPFFDKKNSATIIL